MWTPKQNKKQAHDVENRLVAARGGGWGRWEVDEGGQKIQTSG